MIRAIQREWYRIKYWAAIHELIDMYYCEVFAKEMQGKFNYTASRGLK